MQITFEELEARRSKWRPVKVDYPSAIDGNPTVQAAITRSLILGLFLELPVGAWVASATKRELNSPDFVIEGLKKNIADETVHERAIRYVCDAYNITTQTYRAYFEVAEEIAAEWASSDVHPLLKAATAEVGVFLPNLSLLTILGGATISDLGVNISRDEQRHGVYNRGVLRKIGVELADEPAPLRRLREATLCFIFDGVKDRPLGLDKDFFLEESHNLMRTGYSAALAEFTEHFVYKRPFENSNRRLY